MRLFFKQWLYLWKRWEWYALVFCPYLIAPIFGEFWIPGLGFLVGIVLISFFMTGMGYAMAYVMVNNDKR